MNNEQMYNMLRAGKFKGHTRIMTENVKTGHRKIVEDNNMATNALPLLFESDYNGTMDFYNLMPLKNLLGGVMLFWNPLTESADNIFPPSQGSNKLTAHAGQTANTNADPTRGAPNSLATVVDAANGTIKFVWDWTLEEGNGQISAAALTHQDFGDTGLTPDGTLVLEKSVGMEVQNITYSMSSFIYDYLETSSKAYPLSFKDNGLGVTVWTSGNTFKENVVRHPWLRPSLIEGPRFDDADQYTIISTRTATLSRSFTSGYTFIAQDSDNYYVMERASGDNKTLYVDIVSKTDMSVTSQTITITETLARPSVSGATINNEIVSDGFIYWISGDDSKTFVRVDMATPANSEILSSSLSSDISLRSTPVVLSDGLILGYNFLVNGDFVYPVLPRVSSQQEIYIYNETISQRQSPLLYQMPQRTANHYVKNGGVLVPYLATVNNLEDVITKNNSETMRCEYMVTFTEGA